ncbi:MAG: mechanosensitive ion channel family protein [Coriobacteriales bacterium]|jgi:small-conductance mechanosensitive channel|nr:mechanosensitive ion channel family protein [Coriobacteriales bacterium]
MDAFLENEYVKKILLALLILLVAAIVAYVVVRLLKHFLGHDKNNFPASSIFVNLTHAAIWVLAACVILDTCFGINVTGLIAALGVGGIALSLGLQDTIANLVGGLQVSITKLVQPGDKIRVGTDEGIVEDITWRHVTLRTADNNTVIIPNAAINKASFVRLG